MQELASADRETFHRGFPNLASGTTPMGRGALDSLANTGYLLIPGILTKSDLNRLRAALEARIGKDGRLPGSRQLLETCPDVRRLAVRPDLLALVAQALGRAAPAVKACLFDKHAEANWTLPWHQDMTVALREPAPVPGFKHWTVKDGVHHAEAPRHLLESMMALRLHLDDCPADKGPLLVVPGSHGGGKLSASRREDLARQLGETACLACAGDALLMRPLLLHRSGPATRPGRRRVLHLEYAAAELPEGLHWRCRVGPDAGNGANG